MYKGKSFLITGGTGSLGKALTKYIVENFKDIKKLVIFSRDEQKQFQMAQEFPESKYPFMRYFIGDVRDKDRLVRAFKGIDFVIHAAAMKHVHIAEYNPDECIKTNIGGAQNVVTASIETGVSKVVALSTDKACSPINLYGATKLTSDKLFIAANKIKGDNPVIFSVVRYGNVMGSNGSVIPFFKERAKTGIFPITHPEMTRFNISIEEGVNLVFFALENALGGELYVPKIPSYNILDIAKAIDKNCKIDVIGIRPGEKIHEEMISSSDSLYTYDIGDKYVVVPSFYSSIDFLTRKFNALKVKEGFNYNSKENSEYESVESLKKKIDLISNK
jgi:UDP-N-acetylglucosamine 4,6-dehydratase